MTDEGSLFFGCGLCPPEHCLNEGQAYRCQAAGKEAFTLTSRRKKLLPIHVLLSDPVLKWPSIALCE